MLIGMARILWLALLGLAAAPVFAQPFPARPVKLIVPFAAGGGNDVFARGQVSRTSRPGFPNDATISAWSNPTIGKRGG